MSLSFKTCPVCGCLTLYGIPVMPKITQAPETVDEEGKRLPTPKSQEASLTPAPQPEMATEEEPAYYSPVTDERHDCSKAALAWDTLGLTRIPQPHAA